MNRIPTKEFLEDNGFKMYATRGNKPCPFSTPEDQGIHWEITISFKGNDTTFDYFVRSDEFPDLGKAFHNWIIEAGFGSYDFEDWLEATERNEEVCEDPEEFANWERRWKREKEDYEKACFLMGEERLISLFQYYMHVFDNSDY